MAHPCGALECAAHGGPPPSCDALLLQVLVFNCDEEFDFKAMGRIFVGLVQCGAWGCFDEFNRLDEEVLSAVSQQIQIIQVRSLHPTCPAALWLDTPPLGYAAGCERVLLRVAAAAAGWLMSTAACVQTALKEGAKKMEFMEKTIDVDRHAGIFVTLNPAGKGYGGRSKLPDNLKQLFRWAVPCVPHRPGADSCCL
jgi:dynein heavy chain 2, cytosolic